jgi:DNA helicase IV
VSESQQRTDPSPHPHPPVTKPVPDSLAAEIAVEQALVDRVYAELAKATERVSLVEAEGLARGRTDRTGDIRDEEITGLFERDALMFNANKRRTILETQYEGLVFGRLDLGSDPAAAPGQADADGAGQTGGVGPAEGVALADGAGQRVRETRYVGRLGVRDDDYEPLVIDWRAPAAAPFYRSTPVEPMGVLRRRVLRCKGSDVIGIEDDLMVPEAPDDLVVVGDGALMAALTRSRGSRMRDIVATIQRHQDEAIRAPARGVTEITGGPGTGKTVVALHRAAYLLYSDRRRYESGGILVVGPSTAYTAYIERVLPSLGEDTVTLRSLGDIADGVTTERLDSPAAAAIKGSLKIRRVLARAARDVVPDSPTQLRAFVDGRAIRLDAADLDRVRIQVLRSHQRNHARRAATLALADAAWMASQGEDGGEDRGDERAVFVDKFLDHMNVEAFIRQWWRPLDAREVLLWLADPDRARRYAKGILREDDAMVLCESVKAALDTGTWSVADVALIDDLASTLGAMREPAQQEVDQSGRAADQDGDPSDYPGHGGPGSSEFGQGDRPDSLHDDGQRDGSQHHDSQYDSQHDDPRYDGSDDAADALPAWATSRATSRTWYEVNPRTKRERLMNGRLDDPDEYAHVLIDEAQDISPMQWRMLGRRGRWASWTVVGDAAQASWPDEAEARLARDQAFGGKVRSRFHMATNYRNATEIFAYAADMIRAEVPDADIPEAVRETGIYPIITSADPAGVAAAATAAVESLLGEVEGSIAVISSSRWLASLRAAMGQPPGLSAGDLSGRISDFSGRVNVVDPMSTKGLEYDATVIVDPAGITAESPGGVRVLYVALTRAAHRMTVLEISDS